MPLFNHTNIRSQEASDPAVVGTLPQGIGNTTHGAGMYLTGTEQPIPVHPYPSAEAAAATSQYHPLVTPTTLTIKQGDSNLLHFFVTNDNAAVRYLLFHDKATAPVATDVPIQAWLIPAGTATSPGYVEFAFNYGAPFALGLSFSISTTRTTFTNSATASEHTIHCEYV